LSRLRRALHGRSCLTGRDLLHGTPGSFHVAMCKACGTGRTLPDLTDDELGAYYPGSYQAYALPGGFAGLAARAWGPDFG
jgi:hypothetical protein